MFQCAPRLVVPQHVVLDSYIHIYTMPVFVYIRIKFPSLVSHIPPPIPEQQAQERGPPAMAPDDLQVLKYDHRRSFRLCHQDAHSSSSECVQGRRDLPNLPLPGMSCTTDTCNFVCWPGQIIMGSGRDSGRMGKVGMWMKSNQIKSNDDLFQQSVSLSWHLPSWALPDRIPFTFYRGGSTAWTRRV